MRTKKNSKLKLETFKIVFRALIAATLIVTFGVCFNDIVSANRQSVLHPSYDGRYKVVNTTHGTSSAIGEVLTPDGYPGDAWSATGFVVGDNTFVTAKHVSDDFSKYSSPFKPKSTESTWFYPAINGGIVPYGKFKVLRVSTLLNYDLSVVTVGLENDEYNGRKLGEVVKPLKVQQFQQSDHHITITGYPADKGDTQWTSSGVLAPESLIQQYQPEILYDLDTSSGQSGSPIFNDSQQVVGIHLNGKGTQNYNSGLGFNKEAYDFIENHIAS